MENEIWKDIPNFEGMYQVSNLGRVKSLPREWVPKEKVLKNKFNKKNGYYFVSLLLNRKPHTLNVHKIVAKTFLGDSNLSVDHINGNKLDNRVENLRFVTTRQNLINHKLLTTGKVGYSYYVKINKYKAGIRHGNKTIHLGYFDTANEAEKAYYDKLNTLINLNNAQQTRTKTK